MPRDREAQYVSMDVLISPWKAALLVCPGAILYVFTMDDIKEAARYNLQRSTVKHREHLTQLLRLHVTITEGISNDNWTVVLSKFGYLIEENPNGGKGKNDKDPLFDKEWSLKP